MKYKVLVPMSGLINGAEWPEVGETIDLPEHVAKGMIESGDVEAVKAPAKKADEPKVEKRPAPTKNVETRKAADK